MSLLIVTLILSSCSIFGPERVRHEKTTSLVNFLYPDGNIPKDIRSPTLRLPLRVGLAYVPTQGGGRAIDPRLKLELLNAIKQEFSSRHYIQDIQIIPQMYLSHRGSGDQLQQIKQLYQLDVMALVSYDQIVNRQDNLLSVTYLTIVGSYLFPGTQFDVSTLIDMALIDLDTKRLLFRAAGTQGSSGGGAEAYAANQYSKHQNRDFAAAMTMLSGNLNQALYLFEERLRAKDPNDDIKVEARPGYSMAIDRWMLLLLLGLCWARCRTSG
ncbi:rhombotarget lipoprotein [Marinicella meishanensis]|uniref:rhombotarget lipoprotein n=1 Tax=Marinicella meishanensis TaxID=2873263 RepID=UPI001CBF786E|nr:rhombotarget lipoprotein [Marinicella sp. NBU2979]